MKKIIICPICGEKLEQKSDLNRHIEKAHPEESPSSMDIPPVEKPIMAQEQDNKYETTLPEHKEETIEKVTEEVTEEVQKKGYMTPQDISKDYSVNPSEVYKPTYEENAADEKEASTFEEEPKKAAEIELFDGIAYPADPEQLIRSAEIRGDEDMARRLRDLPIKEYADATEIAKALRVSEKKE